MADCSACGAALETPLGCEACGIVLESPPESGPFDIFGLKPTWNVDERDLKRRLRRFGRIVHPDFHMGDPAQQALAETNSAALNRAFEVLLDPFLRADWILERLGGPSEQEERQMPQAFLMEVLDWNETLDAAEGAAADSPERQALDRLAETLTEERDARMQAIGRKLSPLPERGAPVLRTIRQELNAIRYLSRALYRIRDLRYGAGEI